MFSRTSYLMSRGCTYGLLICSLNRASCTRTTRAECTKPLVCTCMPLRTLYYSEVLYCTQISYLYMLQSPSSFFWFQTYSTYSRHLDSFRTKYVFVLNNNVYLVVLKYFIVYKLRTRYMARGAYL